MLNRSTSCKGGLTTRDKTPTRNGGAPGDRVPLKTPGSASRASRTSKTPGKTARLTPSRNPNFGAAGGNKTPGGGGINALRGGGGDRMMPDRQNSQFELAHFLITSQSDSLLMNQQNVSSNLNGSTSEPCSPAKLEYQRAMRDALNGGVTAPASKSMGDVSITESQCRIFAYQRGKAPLAPQGYANGNRVLYSARATPAVSCKKTTRHIPAQPDRILDAPDLLDDYYPMYIALLLPSGHDNRRTRSRLRRPTGVPPPQRRRGERRQEIHRPKLQDLNLIDWSSRSNHVAVALAGNVYLWNATSSEIALLMQLAGDDDQTTQDTDYVSAVNFFPHGNYLAVGLSTGVVQLWDVERSVLLRTMTGHASRVGSLSWNQHLVSSGSRTGAIHHHDVRAAEHLVGRLSDAHTQEVCGLRWSPDGRHLASGANDNLVKIWPQQQATASTDPEGGTAPLHVFSEHQAAVKALAWCPWQPSILASGGGTADRKLRLWNVSSGSCISDTDAQSQICSIVWNSEYKEMITGHGYPSNPLTIWKYPQMIPIQQLEGHTGRVLQLAGSACGEFVMSAAADESLRIWHCFAVDPDRKAKQRHGGHHTAANKHNTPAHGLQRAIR